VVVGLETIEIDLIGNVGLRHFLQVVVLPE